MFIAPSKRFQFILFQNSLFDSFFLAKKVKIKTIRMRSESQLSHKRNQCNYKKLLYQILNTKYNSIQRGLSETINKHNQIS